MPSARSEIQQRRSAHNPRRRHGRRRQRHRINFPFVDARSILGWVKVFGCCCSCCFVRSIATTKWTNGRRAGRSLSGPSSAPTRSYPPQRSDKSEAPGGTSRSHSAMKAPRTPSAAVDVVAFPLPFRLELKLMEYPPVAAVAAAAAVVSPYSTPVPQPVVLAILTRCSRERPLGGDAAEAPSCHRHTETPAETATAAAAS